MYNRYIRADDGSYERIPQQEAPPGREEERQQEGFSSSFSWEEQREAPRSDKSDGGFLKRVLKKLNLEEIDTGDLLLLLLILFLFSEGEDEELLFALGLLLLL